MKQTQISSSVNDAAEKIKTVLLEKKFKIFADINHKENACSVDLLMAESRVIIFGTPLAGTKLMQEDITISFDLPLRIAIVEKNNSTVLLYNTSDDYKASYQFNDHPILENIDNLFTALITSINTLSSEQP